MARAENRNNGSYTLIAYLGYKEDGTQIKKTKTWKPEPGISDKKAQKEASKAAEKFEEQCRRGIYIDPKMTLKEFSEKWLEEYAKKELRLTTVEGYQILLRRINQAIGHIKVVELNPLQLVEFYNSLREAGVREDLKYKSTNDFGAAMKEKGFTHRKLAEKSGISRTTILQATKGKHISGASVSALCRALEIDQHDYFGCVGHNKLSANTVQHYHKLLSTILNRAMKWRLIEVNPCVLVDAPRAERKEAKFLDDKQAAEMLKHLDKEDIQLKTFVYTAVYLGLRRGELCGLKWEDVDFEQGILHVRRNLQYSQDTGLYFTDTKTQSSYRVLKMPTVAMNMLRAYKAWQSEERLQLGDKWNGEGTVFTTWDGAPVIPNTMSSKFRQFMKKTNLPYIPLHGLRHTNATLLIMGNTNIKTVSSRLGHSAVSITGDIYTHAIKTADEIAADTLDDVLPAR